MKTEIFEIMILITTLIFKVLSKGILCSYVFEIVARPFNIQI